MARRGAGAGAGEGRDPPPGRSRVPGEGGRGHAGPPSPPPPARPGPGRERAASGPSRGRNERERGAGGGAGKDRDPWITPHPQEGSLSSPSPPHPLRILAPPRRRGPSGSGGRPGRRDRGGGGSPLAPGGFLGWATPGRGPGPWALAQDPSTEELLGRGATPDPGGCAAPPPRAPPLSRGPVGGARPSATGAGPRADRCPASRRTLS